MVHLALLPQLHHDGVDPGKSVLASLPACPQVVVVVAPEDLLVHAVALEAFEARSAMADRAETSIERGY